MAPVPAMSTTPSQGGARGERRDGVRIDIKPGGDAQPRERSRVIAQPEAGDPGDSQSDGDNARGVVPSERSGNRPRELHDSSRVTQGIAGTGLAAPEDLIIHCG